MGNILDKIVNVICLERNKNNKVALLREQTPVHVEFQMQNNMSVFTATQRRVARQQNERSASTLAAESLRSDDDPVAFSKWKGVESLKPSLSRKKCGNAH